ncbi:hypothetical protein GWI33_009885, partial [Rhynchophorus ferrugineus]
FDTPFRFGPHDGRYYIKSSCVPFNGEAYGRSDSSFFVAAMEIKAMGETAELPPQPIYHRDATRSWYGRQMEKTEQNDGDDSVPHSIEINYLRQKPVMPPHDKTILIGTLL